MLTLYPRSGLGFRYRLQLNNTVGVIDSDYYGSDNEGHIQAKITNDSREGKELKLEAGTGFMQGIFLEYGITEGRRCGRDPERRIRKHDGAGKIRTAKKAVCEHGSRGSGGLENTENGRGEKEWEKRVYQAGKKTAVILAALFLLSGCGSATEEMKTGRTEGIALLESGDYEGAVSLGSTRSSARPRG